MRITVTREAEGQVRIVPRVDIGRVSVMEGYNGVGKSALVRVLQACCGTLPYREGDRPWTSLREGVGPARVEVSGLADDEHIEWHFDTRDWIDRKGLIATDWFRSIRVNGEPATLERVRATLVVHRVAGDESVVETLARQADGYQDAVGRWLRELEEGSRRATADDAAQMLARLAAQAGSVDMTVLAADQDALEGARTRVAETAARERRAEEALQRLREAADTAQQLAELREQGPGLEDRLRFVVESLRAAEAERRSVSAQVEVAAGSARLGEGVQRNLANAERTLARNVEKLQDASVRLSAALQPFGLPADPQAVAAALTEATDELQELNHRKVQADAVPEVRHLLTDLVTRLDTAVQAGLGPQSLVDDDSGRPTSAAYYRHSFDQRRETLKGLPPAPETAQIERRLQKCARRVTALRDLPQLFEAVDQYRRRVQDNTARVTALSNSPELDASAVLKQLQTRRSELDEIVLEFATEQARLVRRKGLLGGGQDELVLASTSRQLLAELGLEDVAELPGALDAAERKLDQCRRLADSARHELDAASAAAASHERALAASRDALRSLADFAWFRAANEHELPGPDTDRESALTRLADIAQRARTGADRLRQIRIQAIAMQSALGAIANRLRGRDEGAVVYVAELSQWLSARFAEYFAQPSLRQALLPPGATDLRVDLKNALLSWSVDGQQAHKPLDAFSSGQQAYLYTRARLALLDETAEPKNRLLCLDEFGAFMDDERRQDLFDYLLDRGETHPTDSVLLILPVRQDYAASADVALGKERERLLALARDLEQPAGVAVRDIGAT